jgi:hypothetical protein
MPGKGARQFLPKSLAEGRMRRMRRLAKSGVGARARVAAALLVAGLASACVTTGDDEANGPPKRVYYVLKRGKTHPHARPLPDATDIVVEWHYSDGSTTRTVGFRGWDVDGDGRFEMVDVLDPQAHVVKRVFDFDGDGRIDVLAGVDE